MDKIILKGMKFYAFHGFLPQEKELGQTFTVDIELWKQLQNAGKKDKIDATINYADVFYLTQKVITGPSVDLIETLAENIAQEILINHSVQRVKVVIKKPSAPVPGIFDYMAVEIERERP